MKLRAAVRWAWNRKGRIALTGVALLVGGYACVFAMVACAVSPTNNSVQLTDGRALAYHRPLAADGESTQAEPAQRLILIHGAPADAGSWSTMIGRHGEALAGFDVVVVDRLGYGNSAEGEELSLERHARSIEPLITDGAIVVGHSYGGPVALRAAVEYADKLAGVILVAGACDPYMGDSVWAREAVDAASPLIPDSWAVANRELLALTAENRLMEPMLTEVTCPVVVVHGTWDPVCPHDGTVEYLERSLIRAAGVKTVSLTRAGHNLHLSHPDVIVGEINGLAGNW
jgi:pimeloyl-ACP methyl ester carboxylesterase